MTIVQLQYVLAVAKYKNFTQAAEHSFVTQPTLSMQIQKLEEELGVEIFDRSSQPIKITPLGSIIVAQSLQVVGEAKKIKELIAGQKESIGGEFSLGIIPTLFSTLLPLFLKPYLKDHPGTILHLAELQTDEILKQLREGTLTIGITATPLEEDDIVENPLFYEPLVAYVPENHKLFQKKILSQKDLQREDLLLLKEGHCFRNNILNLCQPSQEEERKIKSVVFDTSNLSALVKLARAGFGATLLPAMQVNELGDTEKDYLRYFADPIPVRQVSIVYHKSMIRQQFVQSIAEAVRHTVKSILPQPIHPTITAPKL